MKIVQFQAMENNATWQGCILGLGDDGVLYWAERGETQWQPFIVEPAEKIMANLSDYLPNRAVKVLGHMGISTPYELAESSITPNDIYKAPSSGKLTSGQIIAVKSKLQLLINN